MRRSILSDLGLTFQEIWVDDDELLHRKLRGIQDIFAALIIASGGVNSGGCPEKICKPGFPPLQE
jgi:hypothetical protein